jgi:hypothetical protein
MLQMRELRLHVGVQLRPAETGESTGPMSALPSGAPLASSVAQQKPKTRGFLHIARHGAGPGAIYVVTYHRLDHDREGRLPRPAQADNSQSLIELLERIGVDFRLGEVRGALADVLRFGSANIPDLWLSDEEMVEKGLVES